MNKYWMLILMALGLNSCHAENEQYYLSHPKELQSAIKNCPNEHPKELSCKDVELLGQRLGRLGYELQANPQAFGHKILVLQQTIAQQQDQLKQNTTDQSLSLSLKEHLKELADRMAVVKWLESPEG